MNGIFRDMFFILLIILLLLLNLFLFVLGKWFSIRDNLENVDVIVCLAGSRGNIDILHERIDTAIFLLNRGFAPFIIMSGSFSEKTDSSPKPFPKSRIIKYVNDGRISKKSALTVVGCWDMGLGSRYMKQYAVNMGVNSNAIITENNSLHTKENAKYTLEILHKHNWNKIILVTSPFHQRRAFMSFKEVFDRKEIQIINFAAISKNWGSWSWYLSKFNRKLILSEAQRIIQYFYA